MKFYESGQGFPIILIHGFPFNHTLWNSARVGLDDNYRVITLDLPGISEDTIEVNLTMKLMAEQIHEYLIQKNIDKCIIFGHSMGGYLGAECLSLFPDKISGLSFIHSYAAADDDEKKLHREKIISFIKKGETEKMSFLKTMIPNLFSDKNSTKLQPNIQKILDECSRIPYQNIVELYSSIKNRNDHKHTIESSQIPIQWIIGQDDSATPLDATLSQVHLADVNVVEILKDCGHMSMIENPKALNTYMKNFCEFVIK